MSLRKNPYRLILKITSISLANVLGEPQLQHYEIIKWTITYLKGETTMSLTSALLWKLVNLIKRKML